MTTTPTWTTSLVVPSIKKYGDPSFNLTNPTSNSPGSFAYISSNTNIATIAGNTVTILGAGTTIITATQASSGIYTSKTVAVAFIVNVVAPTIRNFIIPKKEFNDISFNLTDPSSNNVSIFTYVSSNPSVATISGRVVSIKSIGTSIITATQVAYGNYSSGTISAELTVFTSIVRTGVQNQLDLSWNIPVNNGSTIKNYFFSSEERATSSLTSSLLSSSYNSYLMPVPYSTPFLSSTLMPTGFDINQANQIVTLSPATAFSTTNYFDMSYNAEVELSWLYHSDNPIEDICSNSVSQTTMTLSLYKRNTVTNTRVDMLRSYERTYDSFTNVLGAIPQNNGKIMKDVFSITFDTGLARDLLYFKKDDVIEGTIKYSGFYYYPSTATALSDEYKHFYSIIVLGTRVVPYRLPIPQDFSGAVVSTGNVVVYYAPKMTRPLTSFNEAKMDISWNYSVDISSALAQSPALLPSPISNFNAPFQLRVRCYSRSFKKIYSAINDASYNTPSVAGFLTSVSDPRYNTYLLFDISRNFTATYNNVILDPSTNLLPVFSTMFDVSGVASFPDSAVSNDPAHTQIVYVFSMIITDPSYNLAFQSPTTTTPPTTTTTSLFKLNILSHTLTPQQIYRFSGPDPTLSSSNLLTSSTKTIYNIDTPFYQDVTPFYRFYNLTNGNYYSYKIATNNMVGTSAFSQLLTRRCGSVPNIIVNMPETSQYYFSESERLSNKISVLWYKPSFSGYEILNFIIQINVDISGRWLNNLEYTQDLSLNNVTFDAFQDIIIPATNHVINQPNEYRYDIQQVSYRTLALAQAYTAKTGILAEQYGSLINGNKYYLRMTASNELGIANYSSVLTGIPITRPENAPATIIGNNIVVGDHLVYLTWKIPPDDGGAPILNYIIDYQEINETLDICGNTIKKLVGTKYRYNQNAAEPTEPTYPKDKFVALYNTLKNRYTMSAAELSVADASRNSLSKYIIPPAPITLFDADIKNVAKDASNNPIIDASKNVVLDYDRRSFTYYGDELTQNVFDISNIQLKWYYFNGGGNWDDLSTKVTFTMSIRGHLKHLSDASLNIDNIFYIPDTLKTYTVTKDRHSVFGSYQYIDYTNDIVIGSGTAPKIPITTLPRIDSYKQSKRYKLNIEYTITSISNSEYKFILYSGPIIINGSAPVRTNASLNTTFTLRLNQNTLSPLDNTKKYRFTITPFNIADYFPTYDANTADVEMGITTASSILSPTYTLVQESTGGKVILRWYYGPKASYYITISIPPTYLDADYPNEYPSEEQNDGTIRSILTTNLTPDASSNVTYTIPSTEPADISVGNAQRYLRAGRAYIITVAPIKTAEVNGTNINLVAPPVYMSSTTTYIVPFMVPLRPTELFAFGYNGYVRLSYKLPNLFNDPNYYISDTASPFYTYRYYSLELRDVSGADPVNWITISDRIAIPANAIEGYTATRDVSAGDGIINEHNYQFRIRLLIQNDYNAQFAFSDYTYITKVNNNIIAESANNIIYPSKYPYKPSVVTSLYALRPSPRSLYVEFNQPSYTGNATYYECFIEYSNDNSVTWSGIFDTSGGIADTSDNTIILTPDNNKLTVNASVGAISSFTITCKSIVLSYTIRVRLLGKIAGVTEPYNFPSLSYTDYSDIVKISI